MTSPRKSIMTNRTRVIIVTLAVIAILVSVVPLTLGIDTHSSAQTTGQITQQWVNQQMSQWRPAHNTSVTFGAVFQRASYDNILYSYNTPQVENTTLSMLLNTGVSCVRIDIGFNAWLKNLTSAQSTMSSLVAQIKSANRCFIIADAAAESYRHGGQIPWDQFKTAWVQRVSTLAALYHPDYYVVIKEPGWYAPMVSDATTNPAFQDPNQWINLTQTLISTVQSVSPNTKVGVAIAADSLSSNPTLYTDFLTGVSKLPGLSFIGFDIYTISGFQNTQNYLSQNGSGGKDVWIAECWSADGSTIYSSSRASLDASWILLVYYFAQEEHVSVLIPFYTDLFASYSLTTTSPTDTGQILSLLQQRTSVFQEYKSIIALSSGSQTSASTQSSSSSSLTRTVTTTSTGGGSATASTSSSSTGSTATPTSSGQKNARSLPLLQTALIVVVLIIAVVVVISLFFRRRG